MTTTSMNNFIVFLEHDSCAAHLHLSLPFLLQWHFDKCLWKCKRNLTHYHNQKGHLRQLELGCMFLICFTYIRDHVQASGSIIDWFCLKDNQSEHPSYFNVIACLRQLRQSALTSTHCRFYLAIIIPASSWVLHQSYLALAPLFCTCISVTLESVTTNLLWWFVSVRFCMTHGKIMSF